MPVSYQYVEDHALLFETMSGTLELREVLGLYDQFAEDPRIINTRYKLCDLRGLTTITISERDLGNLLDLIAGQYLHRLGQFTAGAFVINAGGAGQLIADMFQARLPKVFQGTFVTRFTPAEALISMGLPETVWGRLAAA